MAIKTVLNSDPGDTDHVGGNDWDNLATSINLGEHYQYLVIKSGSTYYVKNSAGEVAHSGSNPTTEIQWALDNLTVSRTWKEKVIIKGDYSIATTIEIGSYTIVEVLGRMKLANAANQPIFRNKTAIVTEGAQDNYIELIGGEIDGNKANQTSGYLLHFRTMNHLKIKNVRSHDAKFDGLTLEGNDDVSVEDCYFYDNNAMGVRLTGETTNGVNTRDVRMVNNHATGNAINGLWVGGSTSGLRECFNILFDANTCYNNSIGGIYVDWHAYGVTVVGNSCESNGNSAGSGGGGGICFNGQANGVPYYGNYYTNIVGNSCYNNDESGIFGVYAKNTRVSNNFCSFSQWHGISLQACKQCQVTDNTCLNNSQKTTATYSGILFYDATGSDTNNYPALDNIFENNTCYDDQGTKTQKYGIQQTGYGYRNTVRNNHLKGNATGAMSITDFTNCYNNEGFRVKSGQYTASTLSDSCSGILQGLVRTYTTTGTITPSISSAGQTMSYATSATANDVTGGRFNLITERDLNPCFKCKFKLSQTTATRLVIGFTSNASNDPTTTNNPLASKTGALLFYDPAVNANWAVHFNNGGAGIINRNTGIAADTNVHELTIFINNNGTGFMIVMLDDVLITPTPEITQIPNAATQIGAYWYIDNTTTAAKTLLIWDVELRHCD